jgi:hypothetical protein
MPKTEADKGPGRPRLEECERVQRLTAYVDPGAATALRRAAQKAGLRVGEWLKAQLEDMAAARGWKRPAS